MFPKVLHQTWRTKDLSSIPEFEACAESWKNFHPAFEYRLWADAENSKFVKEVFPSYQATWESFDKNIKRIDSIRYMWMHKYGGIYADLDMECLQGLDELMQLYADYDIILFCDFDADGKCMSANPALMISKPKSDFWLEVLEHARINRDRYVTSCTGPYALAAVVNSLGEKHRVKCLDQNQLFIRKSRKNFYTKIAGNQFDFEIYRNVYCTTQKPEKYYEDRKCKVVADWHGTPEEFRWHNEYPDRKRSGSGLTKLTAQLGRWLRL
jgi:mannosyltransferase OCH1-like enzyme